MFTRLIGIALALAPCLTLAAPALLASATAAEARSKYASSCGSESYINSRGNCVHRPVASPRVPAGASAQCRDGTYSFSQSRRGTCSHHGGVSRWL